MLGCVYVWRCRLSEATVFDSTVELILYLHKNSTFTVTGLQQHKPRAHINPKIPRPSFVKEQIVGIHSFFFPLYDVFSIKLWLYSRRWAYIQGMHLLSSFSFEHLKKAVLKEILSFGKKIRREYQCSDRLLSVSLHSGFKNGWCKVKHKKSTQEWNILKLTLS